MAKDTKVIMVSGEAAARQQLADEVKELRQRGRLDETVPGGRYIGVDGKLHNAHGHPIEGGKPALVIPGAEIEPAREPVPAAPAAPTDPAAGSPA